MRGSMKRSIILRTIISILCSCSAQSHPPEQTVSTESLGSVTQPNPIYSVDWSATDTLDIIRKDSRYRFAKKTGGVLVEPRHQWINGFYEGLAAAGMDEEYHYINEQGEVAIRLPADGGSCGPFQNGLARRDNLSAYREYANEDANGRRSPIAPTAKRVFESGLLPLEIDQMIFCFLQWPLTIPICSDRDVM